MKRFENLVLHKLKPNAIRHVVTRYLLFFAMIYLSIFSFFKTTIYESITLYSGWFILK
jgi:hypothetical protein